MIRQTFHIPLFAFSLIPRLSRRVLAALCGLGLGCSVASASSTAGLGADSADPFVFTDSLSSALVTSTLELPDGQVLSEPDFAHLLAVLQDPPSGGIPADVNARVQSVLTQALAQLGVPYRWGGNTPESGFDCSGLVKYVFQTALGIELPRVSRDQAQDGQPVNRQELTPGDLVFFSRRGKVVNHVGIYLGDDHFVHAPRRGRDVSIERLNGYWSRRLLQARRIIGLGN